MDPVVLGLGLPNRQARIDFERLAVLGMLLKITLVQATLAVSPWAAPGDQRDRVVRA